MNPLLTTNLLKTIFFPRHCRAVYYIIDSTAPKTSPCPQSLHAATGRGRKAPMGINRTHTSRHDHAALQLVHDQHVQRLSIIILEKCMFISFLFLLGILWLFLRWYFWFCFVCTVCVCGGGGIRVYACVCVCAWLLCCFCSSLLYLCFSSICMLHL